MRKILGCFIFIMIMITSQIFATTYYVDATNGNDNNSGTSPESAWKTINKVNNSYFYPSDSILFKRGEVWREQLIIPSSGSPGNPITFGAYGSGDNPIINGSDLIKGWTNYSGKLWQSTCNTEPKQVYFDDIRGTKKASKAACTSEYDWYWESNIIYCFCTDNPDTEYTSVEADTRNYGIYISEDYITVDGLQIEKTKSSSIKLYTADHCSIQNCTFYQWVLTVGSNYCGVWVRNSSNNTITSNTFGKNTANDADGPNWAGYKGVYVESGSSNTTISDNYFYHSGDESISDAFYGYAIHLHTAGGTDTISDNTFYHTASHGIYVDADTNSGDVINIHDNTTSYTGQAGISLWQTRGADGTGGTINIYNNIISYANRTAGTTPANGNAACGIHLNDSATPDPSHPFVTCNIFNNIVHDCQAPASPNNEDSGGIAIDYNTENANVYCNLIYNNYGKGIYIYNANNNSVYYNIIYGNDCGIIVSAAAGYTAYNNVIYNNVCYKNYNGSVGPGYNTEIYFGLRGDNNLFKNNIIYADNNGYAYYYETTDTSGCITDYNLVYKENGILCYDTVNGAQTFSEWLKNHSSFDNHSLNSEPIMSNPSNLDFTLKSNSPCIDAGAYVGLSQDYAGNTIPSGGGVDIGAFEYQGSVSPLSAEINASPTSGYTPLSINFTGSTSGGKSPYTYSWDFGDGSTSSSQNPSHTFSSAGTYTVILTVNDANSNTATDSLTITASAAPSLLSVSASASTISGVAPLTVNFTGSASGGTSPYSYSWNFDDGQSSSEQNPSHTFRQEHILSLFL